MGLYVSGLTQAELESYCDIAQSTRNNYDTLKEQLTGLQDNLNRLKNNFDSAKENFNNGFSGKAAKDVNTNLSEMCSCVDQIVTDIDGYIEACTERRTFYENLRSNIRTAISNVDNKYSTAGVDYAWYEGGSLREASKINDLLDEKNAIRYTINGSNVSYS